LNYIEERQPGTVAIMVTRKVDVPNTIAALRGGAHDFIRKPVKLEELRITLRNASEVHALRREVQHVRNEQARKFSFSEIIGDSGTLARAIELARRVGESGLASMLLYGAT